MTEIRLTQYSHGAGCGCKLSPAILERILAGRTASGASDASLIVGNSGRDDAAVWDLGDGRGLVSTTDFFMPIVDDPETFGRIAAANAISDVYAMGGRPTLALGILGWPVDKLAPEVAGRVTDGARDVCAQAGATLAGGHSIDSPEPIFGLAVTGIVDLEHLKQNEGANAGDLLFLTKPLGVGLLTTAEKRGALAEEHVGLAARWMTRLNSVGEALGALTGVTAMTDVSGFGLLGHLGEVCAASGLGAEIALAAVPRLPGVDRYLELGTVPGGTHRNWDSYGADVAPGLSDSGRALLCDPQTSGGLLVAASPDTKEEVMDVLHAAGLAEQAEPIGVLTERPVNRPPIAVTE